MKTNHTPGPWKADLSPGSFRTVDGADGECVAKVDLVITKANSNKWQPDTETTEANTRLIASAPELLEALQALVDYCQTPRHQSEGMTRAPKQSQIDFARAAISKAINKSRHESDRVCQLCSVSPYVNTAVVGGVETMICDDPRCISQCD